MIQRVCERCGDVISHPTKKNCIGYEPYYLKLYLFKQDEETAEKATAVDLCNQCRDKFDDWLMGAQEEE